MITPGKLREQINEALTAIAAVSDNEAVVCRFEDIYSCFALVKGTTTNEIALCKIESDGEKWKMASFSSRISQNKLEYIIYEMITIKDFGGKI